MEDHYRLQYFEVLDIAIAHITDQPGYAVYKNLERLLVKAANGQMDQQLVRKRNNVLQRRL